VATIDRDGFTSLSDDDIEVRSTKLLQPGATE
jgi:hypothetical protein